MRLLVKVSVFIGTVRLSASINDTDQKRLVKTILADYDKTLRPVIDIATVTNVTLNPGLFGIISTDAENGYIIILQSFRMTWIDAFLQWNPSDYEQMQRLRIPITRIWIPDISTTHMIHVESNIPAEQNYAIIDSDGTVLVTFDQVLTFPCAYHTPTDLTTYDKNAEWDLISMTARRKNRNYGAAITAWVVVYYDFLIQRKPAYYLLTFVLSCFMITTISITGIFAPFSDAGHREEKVTMGLTTLLTMAVILTLITDKLPKSSEGMPILAIYIMLQIAIAAVASLMSVPIMYQHRKWTTGKPISYLMQCISRQTCKKGKITKKEEKFTSTAAAPVRQFYKVAWLNFQADEMTDGQGSEMTDRQGSIKQQFVILGDMQSMVRQLVEHQNMKDEEEHLRAEWERASQRLDLFFMIAFHILNFILTASFLLVGYSYLEI